MSNDVADAAVVGSLTRSRRGIALLCGCGVYEDEHLSTLRAPRQDIASLTGALGDPAVGNYDVRIAIDEPVHTVTNAIADVLQDCRRADIALLYFSCHGVKDDHGRLYIAARDTRLDRLRTSAVRASLLHEEMEDSRAQQIVVLLDCCFSGAFSREMAPRAGL
jgi:hypothetical protein